MSDAAIHHYLDEFTRTRGTHPGSDLGEQALAYLQQQGFPTTRQENWKYTDVKAITKRRFRTVAAADSDATLLAAARFDDLACHELLFVNGVYVATADHQPLPEGVTVQPLLTALQQQPTLLKQLGPLTETAYKHSFSALNLAFLTGGALISIADDTELETPINLIYLANQQAEPVAAHPFNLILLGKHARATVIESYLGADDAEYFTNSRTRIRADASATLVHYKIQQESLKAFHIGHTDIEQKQDSTVTSHSIALGAALARNDIDTDLAEPGATINLNGLYLTNGRQHIDNHTRVDHLQPNTSSNENYRGVMNDHSRAVFNGKVVVHEQAQKTAAHQSNANLLLSDNAEVDTKPELEIYADDVQCSHGATVGQLDEDMLFYLRSRAIDEHTATSLLTYAFADEVIKAIDIRPIRERLEYIVAGKLPDSELIKEFMS
ncbi:MAG: Fe-S cluster assembly protein SufD [Gammaproteobacteria bacterium]